jgi:hypothetical protein
VASEAGSAKTGGGGSTTAVGAVAAVVIVEQQTPMPPQLASTVTAAPHTTASAASTTSRGRQQDDQVAECQVESVNRDNNSIIHNSKPQQASDGDGLGSSLRGHSGGGGAAGGVAEDTAGVTFESILAGDKEEKQQPQPSQPLLSSANGNANEATTTSFHRQRRTSSGRATPATASGRATPTAASSAVPVLRKVGEKTPPGTLKKLSNSEPGVNSCRDWCQQYSQTFLKNVTDTPLPDPGPYSEDEDT